MDCHYVGWMRWLGLSRLGLSVTFWLRAGVETCVCCLFDGVCYRLCLLNAGTLAGRFGSEFLLSC